MIKCKKCGANTDEHNIFCTECGAKVEQQKEKASTASKGNKKLIVVGSVAAILILAIITLIFLVPKGETVVCNPPYIHVGTDCCLDKNSNSICDKDEVSEKQEASETENAFGTNKEQPSKGSNAAAKTPAGIDITDSPSKGDKDAPVILIEFSDFQCPFCARFYSDTLGQIEKQYVDTDKVLFVYKHFPLDSIHPQATPAALAVECANEQGKFWEYHDLLFSSQTSLSDATYKKLAADLALDTGKFNDCYDSQKYISKVRDDLQEGTDAGIRGTPGFFANEQIISGAQPFAKFEEVIDSELNKVGQPLSQKQFYCGDGICDESETNFECPDDCQDTDLSSLPFLIAGTNKVSYVIGNDAEAEDIQLTVNLISSITPFYNENVLIASEIPKSNYQYLILVGTPCNNEKTAGLLEIEEQQCSVSFDRGVGIIKLVKAENKTFIILTGNNIQGVSRAVTAFADFKNNALRGREIHIVTGANGKIELQYLD